MDAPPKRSKFTELADAQVGDVRHLCVCDHCGKLVRVGMKSGAGEVPVARYHRRRKVECPGSEKPDYQVIPHSLQERRRASKDGALKLIRTWVRVIS